MTDYKKLSEALQTIKDECKKYDSGCLECPLYDDKCNSCGLRIENPEFWKIKPIPPIRLLESE